MYNVHFIRGHKQGCILHHCSWPGWIKSNLLFWSYNMYWSQPSCSKLYKVLVNMTLKFLSWNMANTLIYFCWKMWVAFTLQKLSWQWSLYGNGDCPYQTASRVSLPQFNSAAHLFTTLYMKGYPPLMWPSGPRWSTWMFSLCDCGREWLYNGWNCRFVGNHRWSMLWIPTLISSYVCTHVIVWSILYGSFFSLVNPLYTE